jgi:hypothetical protein
LSIVALRNSFFSIYYLFINRTYATAESSDLI